MTSWDDAVEALPKVELHCHVEGTMRPALRAAGVLATVTPTTRP